MKLLPAVVVGGDQLGGGRHGAPAFSGCAAPPGALPGDGSITDVAPMVRSALGLADGPVEATEGRPGYAPRVADALPMMRRRDRVRLAARQPETWLQLGRFTAVGATGYLINLAVFGAWVHGVALDFHLAAVVAFLVAVTSNFVWNRLWTFSARDGNAGHQAARFLAVSVGAFVVSLLVLELLVTGAGLPKLVSQAIAVAAATPCNFVGNKLWTFGA